MADPTMIDAPDGPAADGGHAQAILVSGAGRLLFVSGQVPVDADGSVPAGFEAQARLAWRNVERQQRAAGMGLEHIVRHTTYLASRNRRAANATVRRAVLSELKPALTVIIAGIWDEAWLLEIEAIAAA